jgi:hypothetical protein
MDRSQKPGRNKYFSVFDIFAVFAGIAAASSAFQAVKPSSHQSITWLIALIIGCLTAWLMRIGFKHASLSLQSREGVLARKNIVAASAFLGTAIMLVTISARVAKWILSFLAPT